jgi:tetratricopeptide (TPR) repeat protein
MRLRVFQIAGIVWTLIYAVFVIWLYATEPRTFRDVANNTQVITSTYEIDQTKFNSALELFHREQYRAARDEWSRADPAAHDARTQFYIAYACYREGWGRAYNDGPLFHDGLEAVNRAINLAPNGVLVVEDPNLQMHTATELKVELEQGIERRWSDFNPFKIFRSRK